MMFGLRGASAAWSESPTSDHRAAVRSRKRAVMGVPFNQCLGINNFLVLVPRLGLPPD